MLLLLLKNGQWDVCTGRHCSAKETGFGCFPNFCCPEKKLRAELDRSSWLGEIMRQIKLRAKPKYKIFLHYSNMLQMLLLWLGGWQTILNCDCPVGWGCRIHWLLLRRLPKKCPGYDTKQSDCESTVCWGCRIHRLHICRRVRPAEWVSWYDTKQSDGEASVMLEFWVMQSTPLLPSLPGPLWLRLVAPDRVLSMG